MKFFPLPLFLVFYFSAFAQGNLQFNQVLTYSQNFNLVSCGTNLCSWTGPIYTVPSGKVWKIEYFTSGGAGVGDICFTINSTVNVTTLSSSSIWLKASDQIQFKKQCNTGASCSLQTGSYFISIIEFNIVP